MTIVKLKGVVVGGEEEREEEEGSWKVFKISIIYSDRIHAIIKKACLFLNFSFRQKQKFAFDQRLGFQHRGGQI